MVLLVGMTLMRIEPPTCASGHVEVLAIAPMLALIPPLDLEVHDIGGSRYWIV